MQFLTAFTTVAIMLFYAVPGFLLIKTKLVDKSHISSFAKLLMYVCQPFLVIYSMRGIPFSWGVVRDMLIVLGIVLFASILLMLFLFLLLRNQMRERVAPRICTLACCMGNYGFMGVPILEALLPDCPEALAYSAMACLALNMVGWTAGSAVITQDIRYIHIKHILLNPTTFGFLAALPLFITGVTFPASCENVIALLARMTTPLCMMIMGMRLATMPPRDIFGHIGRYGVIAVKQILFPLLMFAVMLPLPLAADIKAAIYIMMCCPVASVVLNYAEMLGEGQQEAASLVLLGTTLSALTVPLMTLLL